MSVRKRSESGPSIQELFSKLERRLMTYEDKTEKRLNELQEKIGTMSQHVENNKGFLENMTEKKTKDSQEKVKNLFEKVYSQDSVCQEEREENETRFEKLENNLGHLRHKTDESNDRIAKTDMNLKNIEMKFETEVGNVEEKFKSSIAIVLEELQSSIKKVDNKLDSSTSNTNIKIDSFNEKFNQLQKTSEGAQQKLDSIAVKEQNLDEIKDKFGVLTTTVTSFNDKIETSATMIDNIEEKMYDFEVSKKNNLIFHGIPAPRNETRRSLTNTIEDIIKGELNIKRDIQIESVHRILKGPDIRVRPLHCGQKRKKRGLKLYLVAPLNIFRYIYFRAVGQLWSPSLTSRTGRRFGRRASLCTLAANCWSRRTCLRRRGRRGTNCRGSWSASLAPAPARRPSSATTNYMWTGRYLCGARRRAQWCRSPDAGRWCEWRVRCRGLCVVQVATE